MMCGCCLEAPAVMCHPFDHFVMSPFGRFHVQEFVLCEHCESLWEFKHLGTLAQRYLAASNMTFRGHRVSMREMYAVMCSIEMASKYKLN